MKSDNQKELAKSNLENNNKTIKGKSTIGILDSYNNQQGKQ
jgi:hypothetical protein